MPMPQWRYRIWTQICVRWRSRRSISCTTWPMQHLRKRSSLWRFPTQSKRWRGARQPMMGNRQSRQRLDRHGTICICFWQGSELPLLHILERRIYRGTASSTGSRRSKTVDAGGHFQVTRQNASFAIDLFFPLKSDRNEERRLFKRATAFPDEWNRKGTRGYLPAPLKVSYFAFQWFAAASGRSSPSSRREPCPAPA